MDPFTIVLLLMLGFAVLLVAGIARRDSLGAPRPLLPRLVAGAALIGALLAAAVGVVGVVLTFVGDRVTLAVPVIARFDMVPDALRATSEATIVSGAAQPSTLSLTIAGLDDTTRALVALQSATVAAVIVTVLVMIARVAQQSIAAEPFTRSLSRLLVASGVTLAVGSMLAQAVGFAAGSRAHEQLFFLRDEAFEGTTYVPPTWIIEIWPVGVGLALIVVARLIRTGERLQRDTTGLV